MLEQEVLKNLYKLIEQYYRILKKQYKRRDYNYKQVEKKPDELKQSILNYETSIFKNIDQKQIPFTQLFQLNKKTIYALNPQETEILRNYLGVYDNGKKQSVLEISKRFNITTSKTTSILKRIIDMFETKTGQELISEERNKEIKKRITNKTYKEKILNSDIKFLNITDNFMNVLRMEKINTVDDLLKITKKQIRNMNKQYGYYYSLEIIPKRLIDEIHEFGLKFENELMISLMFQNFKGIEIDSDKTIGSTFDTLTDAICARQFEPELLYRLNLEDNLKIDNKLNRGYMQEKYEEYLSEAYEIQKKVKMMKMNELDYRHGKIYQSRNN